MNGRAFLGAGMKFPPQIDPGTGRFAISAGEQSVRESVYLILMTSRGERWLEPNFGSQMSAYAFMDTMPTMLRMIFYHFIKDSSVLQLFLEGKISAEFVEEMLCKDYDYMVSRECEALIARAAFAGKLRPDTIHRHLVANGYFLALGGQY